MLFNGIRIILWLVFSFFIFLLVRRTKIVRKKFITISMIILCMVVISATAMFPIENLFIKFQSPEDIFRYTCSGEIEGIVYGNDSCMIYYTTKTNSYSYSIIPKSVDGYKISSYFTTKRITHKIDRSGIFDVYHVLGTNDYYVLGMVNSEKATIELFDNEEKIDSEIKRVHNTSFIYFFVNGFTNEYYLLVNDEKITLS